MRSIKIFISGIIIMFAFLAIGTLFLPSKVTVSKTIFIDATEADVVKQVGAFENWKNWYPAFQGQNAAVIISQKGDTSFSTVTDERQRKLSLSMIHTGPENIDVLLSEGNKNNVTYQFILSTNSQGQTQLTWDVNTTLTWYPWVKITGIFLDKVRGSQYLDVLQNLKTVVEKTHHEGVPK